MLKMCMQWKESSIVPPPSPSLKKRANFLIASCEQEVQEVKKYCESARRAPKHSFANRKIKTKNVLFFYVCLLFLSFVTKLHISYYQIIYEFLVKNYDLV